MPCYAIPIIFLSGCPQVAYGKDGAPTKALTGFAAKNGVELEECTKEADAKGVEYVWAVRQQSGRHAAEVRTDLCRLCYAVRHHHCTSFWILCKA